MTPEPAGLLLAASRWLLYVAVLGLVGAAGARFVTTRGLQDVIQTDVRHRIDRFALFASMLVLLALGSTLAGQVFSWYGTDAFDDYSVIHEMLVRTRWGTSWVIAFLSAGAGAAVNAFVHGRGGPAAARLLAPAAAIVTTPLLGHAAGAGPLLWFLHAGHLLGTSVWLGTLLMLVLPNWKVWRDELATPAVIRGILEAFTPVALSGAAITMATGVLISVDHVWPVGNIFTSLYGQTLTVKIAAVALIGLLGWINWRRLRPAVHLSQRRRQLRRAVVAELALAFGFVLAVTAWLSGLAPPM